MNSIFDQHNRQNEGRTDLSAYPSDSVCLINPPSPFLLDERVFPSLGLLKVAASLESASVPVHILDLSGVENFLEVLENYLDSTSSLHFGLTATTPQLPSVFNILKLIRRLRPLARVILGGPHVTLVASASKMESRLGREQGRGGRAFQQLLDHFDVVVSGDGELAVLRAILPDPPNFIDGDDPSGNFFMSRDFYDQSPMPARHLIDLESYQYKIEGHLATSLIAQLGCPFNCGFCGGRNSKSLRVIRSRSHQSVLDEIEFLHSRYGYTGFMFYDDELNVNKGMVDLMNGLSDLQNRLGTDFRLRGFVKSELFTDEQASAMYRAGFRWLLSGFEAADPRILTNINKKATVDDNTRAVEIAARHGLKVKALMSCGHPGESEDSIQAIHSWLVRNQVDDFDCTIITPYPGTPYYDLATPNPHQPDVWTYTAPKTGDRLHSFEIDYSTTANFYKGIPGQGYQSFVYSDHLTPQLIVRLRDWVESETRRKLDIPFNPSRAAQRYEHSMGQGLPPSVLKPATHKVPGTLLL